MQYITEFKNDVFWHFKDVTNGKGSDQRIVHGFVKALYHEGCLG